MPTAAQIPQLIASAASSAGVDPNLAIEVATQESSLNPNAIGAAGEIGLFQLMPATAAQLGVDPTNITQNIQGGVEYLAQLLAEFGGNVAQALAAYNAGPGTVSNAIAAQGANWFSAIPGSTQNYVQTILGALGTQYTVTPVPVGVAQDLSDVADDLTSAASGLTWSDFETPALLLGAALIGFLLVRDFMQA